MNITINYIKQILHHILFVLIIFSIIGCGTSSIDEGTESADVHGEEKTDQVHLNADQMKMMKIKLGEIQELNMSTSIKSNGILELPPQNKASLSTMMEGRVNSIYVLQGDYVKKGQVLATLEHPAYIEIQEQYMTARSQLNLKKHNYDRKKELFADSVSSASTFQQAEADYLTALAITNSLKAKLEMLNINVTAVEEGKFVSSIPVRTPIKGFIRSIEVNIGKFVQPAQEMFEIVDNEHIHIDLMVYEKDIERVMKNQQVLFSLSTNPDSIFQGRIFSVGKAFEEAPKAMLVHAEIDNKTGNLLPGMYVDARIITDEHTTQAVPKDAIVNEGGLNYIFVLETEKSTGHSHDNKKSHAHNDDGSHILEFNFNKIEVTTGTTDIGFTELVTSTPLKEHTKVVIHGAFYLLAEMNKGEGGHGHSHGH